MCVCDPDKVAVRNCNGWFHDNYVSHDHIIIELRHRYLEYKDM
jgi:hypothetical protein